MLYSWFQKLVLPDYKVAHVSLNLYTVKPVYNGEQREITKLAFVDKWPLLGVPEAIYMYI